MPRWPTPGPNAPRVHPFEQLTLRDHRQGQHQQQTQHQRPAAGAHLASSPSNDPCDHPGDCLTHTCTHRSHGMRLGGQPRFRARTRPNTTVRFIHGHHALQLQAQALTSPPACCTSSSGLMHFDSALYGLYISLQDLQSALSRPSHTPHRGQLRRRSMRTGFYSNRHGRPSSHRIDHVPCGWS